MYVDLYVKYRYSCKILMKLEFSGQIFEKYWSNKFYKNPCEWREGEMDRDDEANSHFW
jgi:hypothetical protein